MSDISIIDKRLAHLQELKQRFGNEADFISKDGFPFNAFDLVWQLDGLGKKGTNIKTTWMLDIDYEESLVIDIRLTLATMAHQLASITVNNMNSKLKTVALPEFSLLEVKSYWLKGNVFINQGIKSFIHRLYRLSPKKYSELNHWVKNAKARKKKPNTYDPEKGALSDIENQDFEIKLNQQMRVQIENGFGAIEPRRDRLHMVGHLTSFGYLIALRFMQILVRRPANLVQLKWGDIIPIGATFNDPNLTYEYQFSDENELQVRMWKAKQKNAFRQAVEREPLILCSSVSKEVLIFRLEYIRRFNLHLNNLNIQLTDDELNEIISRSPIFFNSQLFSTNFSDKVELFNALGKNSHSFHISSGTLGANIGNVTSRLKITSDRVAYGTLKVTNNRLRHTVGTNAVRAGLPLTRIAKLMGNNPESAKTYLDLSNEQRASIDDRFVGNTFLMNAFSTNLVELLSDPDFILEDEFGNEAGQAKSKSYCLNCTETRPIGCYGCGNFQALITGDHMAILGLAKTKYELRVGIGEAPITLKRLEIQIRYIQETVKLCDIAILRGSGLDDK